MRCPKCTSIEDKVIDSRISKEGSTIRRRRECLECNHRFTTTETLVREGLVVIKRDGRREDFDREKLIRATRAACHKRPVDAEQISMLVEDVIDILEAQYDHQIPSRAIGDAVIGVGSEPKPFAAHLALEPLKHAAQAGAGGGGRHGEPVALVVRTRPGPELRPRDRRG